jgi:hypothetical protein
MAGIPACLQERLVAAKVRLGRYRVVLLGGHPTPEELAAGARAGAVPVSEHNCWCDAACVAQARAFGHRR